MKHQVPAAYAALRNKLSASEINFGYSGIALAPLEMIPEAQLGYSIIPEGVATDWDPSWLVIGHEISLGDPIFLDTSKQGLPVFTAPHGEGSWSPAVIATSVGVFFEILARFAILAKERQHPVALESNPLSDEERENFLAYVSSHFGGETPEFWELLVSTDL